MTRPPSATRFRATGMAGEALRCVTIGTIAAVVGRHARQAESTHALLRRYHTVQVRLFERFEPMLPVRYGTTAESLDELRAAIRRRETPLRERLRAVRHRVQMNVRMPATAEQLRAAAPAREPRSGLAYLRQRQARAERARRPPEFLPLRATVARWIRDERATRAAGVVSIYHLVPRSAAETYRRALTQAATDRGMALAVSGPFPPFAFVDAD